MMVSVFFFAAPFLIGSRQIPKHFPEKITQKTGSRPACAAELDRFQVMINTGARLAQSGVAFAPPPSGRPTSRSSFGQQIYSREPGRIIFDVPVDVGCIAGAGSTPKVKLSPLAREVVGTLLKLRLRRHLPRGFILVIYKLGIAVN